MPGMSATTLTSAGRELEQLASGVRSAIAMCDDWSRTAELVADQLRAHLPSTDILTEEQRRGLPDRAVGHTLHVEPDGSFSITAVVWRPGQFTRIHDHTTWCVFGVIQGVKHEEVYDADLNLIGSSDGTLGDVNGFAPLADIHRGPQHRR
jgi:predicted metal-dependent enzyme (double-stranded beta helix superfamily)